MNVGCVPTNFVKAIQISWTLSVVDAEELANRAYGSGVLIMVDHTHLFNPAYRKLKTCGMDLGRLLRIESSKKFHSSVELGRQMVEVLARCEAKLDTQRCHDLSSTCATR